MKFHLVDGIRAADLLLLLAGHGFCTWGTLFFFSAFAPVDAPPVDTMLAHLEWILPSAHAGTMFLYGTVEGRWGPDRAVGGHFYSGLVMAVLAGGIAAFSGASVTDAALLGGLAALLPMLSMLPGILWWMVYNGVLEAIVKRFCGPEDLTALGMADDFPD